jgi:hypothetical protein
MLLKISIFSPTSVGSHGDTAKHDSIVGYAAVSTSIHQQAAICNVTGGHFYPQT